MLNGLGNSDDGEVKPYSHAGSSAFCENKSSPSQQDHTEILSPAGNTATVDADADCRHLEALIECLDEDFGPYKRRADYLLLKNKTEYSLLWCIFPSGSDVVFNDPSSGVPSAGRVNTLFIVSHIKVLTAVYKTRYTFSTSSDPHFELTVRCIDYNGIVFHYRSHVLYINTLLIILNYLRQIRTFEDILDVGSIPAQPLSDENIKSQFKARGEKFVRLKGWHHLQYSGSVLGPAPVPQQYPPPPHFSMPPPYRFDHPFNSGARLKVGLD